MLKRIIISIVVLLALAASLAQDAQSWTQYETRLSIVETRLGLVEGELVGLKVVPVQLGRIETKLEALAERSSGNSNVLQQLAMTVVVALLTGGIGLMIGRNRGNK